MVVGLLCVSLLRMCMLKLNLDGMRFIVFVFLLSLCVLINVQTLRDFIDIFSVCYNQMNMEPPFCVS